VPQQSLPESYRALVNLRRDLERARSLADLIKRREKLKRDYYRLFKRVSLV